MVFRQSLGYTIRTKEHSLKLIKNKEGELPQYQIVGSIDETSDFEMIIVQGKELHLDCYEVARINLVGVKKWIRYFNDLNEKGIELFFYAVSSALVSQLNVIKNFRSGGTVVSVSLPFLCTHCNLPSIEVRKKSEVMGVDFENEVFPCPHCGNKAMKFDDDPEEYFHFWTEE